MLASPALARDWQGTLLCVQGGKGQRPLAGDGSSPRGFFFSNLLRQICKSVAPTLKVMLLFEPVLEDVGSALAQSSHTIFVILHCANH